MTWFPTHVHAFVVILSAAKDLVLTFAVPRLPFTPFGFVVILRSAAKDLFLIFRFTIPDSRFTIYCT